MGPRLCSLTALKKAHIHCELVAAWMNESATEPDAVAGWPWLAAIGSGPRIAGRALQLQRRVTGPFLAACGAGDDHGCFSFSCFTAALFACFSFAKASTVGFNSVGISL